VDGVDDLGAVDALEVDRGDAEAGVSELALDDDQRDTFARHLDGVGVAELVRANRRRTPASAAVWRSCSRAAAALAAADEHCAAAGVEVGLGERERFVDARPGAPEHDDQPSYSQAVRRGAGLTHDGGRFPRRWVDRRDSDGPCCAAVGRVEARHRGR
jgi:hypothetical protein